MSGERPFVAVFQTRRLEEANRAEALLRGAGFPVERTRMLAKVELPMPDIPEDGLQISWIVKAPYDRRKEAEQALSSLIQETGGRPARRWVGPLYMGSLIVFLIVAMAMQNC